MKDIEDLAKAFLAILAVIAVIFIGIAVTYAGMPGWALVAALFCAVGAAVLVGGA